MSNTYVGTLINLQDINDFQLLGQSTDTAPGEIFDKIARRLNIYQNYEFRDVPGMYFLALKKIHT